MNEILLAMTAIAILFAWLYTMHEKDKQIIAERDNMIAEREMWKQERQQLLDRIQSGSFAEYKTQEIRVIKAQSGEKEPQKLEIM